jgi:hypothetical protein
MGTGSRVFRAYDRGIVVASLYATSMILALLYVAPDSIRAQLHKGLGVQLAVVAVFGLVAGAIGGFSNTIDGESGQRDLERNVFDGGMILLWTANALLAANLALRFTAAPVLLRWIGALAGGVALGALVGEPLLRVLVRVRVRGRQPLLWVNAVTQRIQHADVRFVTRVIVQTIVVLALMMLAFVAAIVVVVLIVLAVIGLVLSIAFGEGGGGTARNYAHDEHAPLMELPPGSKILGDGRVVQEGFLFDKETGMRIDEDGRLVKEGLLFDKPTGVRIDEDGRILKEGFIFDKATGVRIVDGELVEEGLLFDNSTGMGFDEEGRVVEKGVLTDKPAGVVITASGKVRRSDGGSDE